MSFESDFRTETVIHDGVGIHCRVAGDGPPLLLLHGYPQTGYMWHKIAPALATDFSVVIADLRGYGDSDKPPTDAMHSPYSKRAMAADMVAVMAHFGHARFAVAGHDRGGRVAHRLARDHGDAVTALAVLDIAPTAAMYGATDMNFATAYYHWFFLIQPAPYPERMIGGDPQFFLEHKTGHWGRTEGAITSNAFAEYLRCFSNPDTIHASCEDYRAAASIDLEHDAADAARKLKMPVLALWGDIGFVGKTYDVVAEWRKVAETVRGHAIPGGHFLAEESPDETLAALRTFFRGEMR
jgi:haloacetate dehalogenase